MPEHDDEVVAGLRELDAWIAVPEAADQRAAVRTRLSRPARRRPRLRQLVVAAVAALLATVAAVAPARAAVVDAVTGVLRVAGIEVRREAVPPVTVPVPLPSTDSVGLAEARRMAPFDVRVPAGLGEPEQVRTADPDDDGTPRVISMVFRGGTVRLDQFAGTAGVFFKQTPEAQWVEVGAGSGIWLREPHALTYVDRAGVERTATARLAGPTLIWEENLVTYRLEGITDLEQARAVGASLR